jgi:hypothetical protein
MQAGASGTGGSEGVSIGVEDVALELGWRDGVGVAIETCSPTPHGMLRLGREDESSVQTDVGPQRRPAPLPPVPETEMAGQLRGAREAAAADQAKISASRPIVSNSMNSAIHIQPSEAGVKGPPSSVKGVPV